MLSQLKKNFSALQEKFSYRQRFVFLAIIFFLTNPLTLYKLLERVTQQDQNLNFGELRLAYQEHAVSLLETSLRYGIFIEKLPSQRKNHEMNILTEEINIEKKIENLNHLESEMLLKESLGSQNLNINWHILTKAVQSATQPQIYKAYDTYISSLLELIKINGQWVLIYGSYNASSSLILQFLFNYLLPAQPLWLELTSLETLPPSLQRDKETSVQAIQQIVVRGREALLIVFNNLEAIHSDKNEFLQELRSRSEIYFNHLDKYINSIHHVIETRSEFNFNFLQQGAYIQTLIFKNVKSQLQTQKLKLQILYWVSLLIFFIASIIIVIFVFFRILTTHLRVLVEHTKKITRGYQGQSSFSNHPDEFGEVSKAFDSVSISMNTLREELYLLNSKLSDTTNKITIAIKNHESKTHDDEARIKEIEHNIDTISQETRQLSNAMQHLSTHISQRVLNFNPQDNFVTMQTKIGELGKRAQNSVVHLEHIQKKMFQLGNQIAFMKKVSESANLLSLNAAIETATVSQHKDSFGPISEQIQRFAVKTVQSTKDIKQILDEMTTHVISVKKTSLKCLHKISFSAEEFINFSFQLSKITQQGEKQLEEFQRFNDRIQTQVQETENMINSITKLRGVAEANSQYILQIHQALGDFSMVTTQLHEILKLLETDE